MVWGALLGGLGTTVAAMGGGAMLDGLGIHPLDSVVQGVKGFIPKDEAVMDEETGTIRMKKSGNTYGIDSDQAMEWFGMNGAKFAERKATRAKDAKAGALQGRLENQYKDNRDFARRTVEENRGIQRETIRTNADLTREGNRTTLQMAREGLESAMNLQRDSQEYNKPMQAAQILGITGNLDIAGRQQNANEKMQKWNMETDKYKYDVQHALANNVLDNQPRIDFIEALRELGGALAPSINIRRR